MLGNGLVPSAQFGETGGLSLIIFERVGDRGTTFRTRWPSGRVVEVDGTGASAATVVVVDSTGASVATVAVTSTGACTGDRNDSSSPVPRQPPSRVSAATGWVCSLVATILVCS